MNKTPRAPFSAHFGTNPPPLHRRKFFLTRRLAVSYVVNNKTKNKDKIAVLCGTFYSFRGIAHRPFHVFKIR